MTKLLYFTFALLLLIANECRPDSPRPATESQRDSPTLAVTSVGMTVGDVDRSVAFYRDVLGVENAVNAFQSYGSTAPEQVRQQVANWKKRLGHN